MKSSFSLEIRLLTSVALRFIVWKSKNLQATLVLLEIGLFLCIVSKRNSSNLALVVKCR